MKVRTSYYFSKLSELDEIDFSEKEELITLSHCVFAELSGIGLSPKDIAAFTGATLDYYQRADQFNFSENDQILYSGSIQSWFAIWGAIKNGIAKAAGGIKYAAKSMTKAGANQVAKKGAQFNRIVGSNGLKSAVHVGSGQSEGFFKRIQSGFKTGSQMTSQMQVGKQLTNQMRTQGTHHLVGSQSTQSMRALKGFNTLKSQGKVTDQVLNGPKTMTNAKQLGQIAQNSGGSVQRTSAATLKQNLDVGKKLQSNQAISQSRMGMTAEQKNSSANAQFYKQQGQQYKQQAKNETDPQKKKELNQKAKEAGQKSNSYSNPQQPQPQAKPQQPQQGNVENKSVTNKAKSFFEGFKDANGNVMGLGKGGQGIKTWATNNKTQAGVAIGAAALGTYGAYRMLRGPRQQPVQQQQPVTVNVNHQFNN